jgi:hypothetical protein
MPKASSIVSQSYKGIDRWSEVEASAVLAALELSGLSAAAFARREGFATERLLKWKRKLAKPAASKPPVFVEMPRRESQQIEVVLTSGVVIRAPETIDVIALRRIVAALARDSEC